MFWFAIHCPALPLDCILRRWPEGLAPALAVTDSEGTRRFVCVASDAARARGVAAGQPVATALALCPDLVLAPRNPHDERAALVEAALAMLSFTPNVSLRAWGLVMEVSASLKLFGGRATLQERIVAVMAEQGLTMRIAAAPTPHGAWLFALGADDDPTSPPRSLKDRLDALPIRHLASARDHLDTLEGIGCATLGDLARLPRAGVGRRFGTALLDELDRACGRRADPQILFEAPARFDARVELMARVEHAEALLFAARRLLGQLAGWLAARRAAVRGFTLLLHHEIWKKADREPTRFDVTLAAPSRDAAHLAGLLRERLTRLELKAPVLELRLVARDVVEEREPCGELFATPASAAESLTRLVEKLAARLGPDAITRIARVADHRPERAWRRVDAFDPWPRAAPAGKSKKNLAALGNDTVTRFMPHPAWLMTPQALEVREHRPVFETPLDLLAGPERIETGWWDDAPATRDYFIAENAGGQLLWVYRERLPVEGDAPQWYLQGLFA